MLSKNKTRVFLIFIAVLYITSLNQLNNVKGGNKRIPTVYDPFLAHLFSQLQNFHDHKKNESYDPHYMVDRVNILCPQGKDIFPESIHREDHYHLPAT